MKKRLSRIFSLLPAHMKIGHPLTKNVIKDKITGSVNILFRIFEKYAKK